jgi:DNA-binding HxlR family transcriptional regulator
MRRTSFAEMQCPVARTLEHAGEWWSLLILRDAFHGLRRFDEFERSLGISPNSLTRRLAALVDAGLLRRSSYQDGPARFEYVLTDSGRDFLPVLLTLRNWGMAHDRPERPNFAVVDARTGEPVDAVLVDRGTGRELTSEDVAFVPTQDLSRTGDARI